LNLIKLKDIEKLLVVNKKITILKAQYIFFGGVRSGLRSSSGHCTASTLRKISQWETYDNTKLKDKLTKKYL